MAKPGSFDWIRNFINKPKLVTVLDQACHHFKVRVVPEDPTSDRGGAFLVAGTFGFVFRVKRLGDEHNKGFANIISVNGNPMWMDFYECDFGASPFFATKSCKIWSWRSRRNLLPDRITNPFRDTARDEFPSAMLIAWIDNLVQVTLLPIFRIFGAITIHIHISN
jgi:hypothetical protein